MASAFFVVQVNALPGEDAELARWYDEQHLDDCLACESAIAAQRFRKIEGSGPGKYSYLALYEVGDPLMFAEDRRSKEGTPLLPRSPALALPAHAFFYRPVPGQDGLLAHSERAPFLIEFLDSAGDEGDEVRLKERKNAWAAIPGVRASELMLVDAYQEREGWHADAIIFVQLADYPDTVTTFGMAQPSSLGLKVVEAGVYQPISARRVRS